MFFLVQNGSYHIPTSSHHKSQWKKWQNPVRWKPNEQSVPPYQNCVCGNENCLTTSSPFFLFNTLNYFFFRCIEFFIWGNIGIGLFQFYFDAIFVIYRFCLKILGSYRVHIFVVGPVKWATLCQRAKSSNLKYKDCCFNQLQTLFAEGNIVQ